MRFLLPLLLVLATPALSDAQKRPEKAPASLKDISAQVERDRQEILMTIKLLRLRVQLLSAGAK